MSDAKPPQPGRRSPADPDQAPPPDGRPDLAPPLAATPSCAAVPPLPAAPPSAAVRPGAAVPPSAPVLSFASVTASAPAKVNLALRVGAARPDGFHDLNSLFQALDRRDRVTVRPASGAESQVSLTGTGAGQVPLDPSNLVLVAARALARRVGRPWSVDAAIDKAIPVAAGLAGGSADAAATLVALAEAWHLELDAEQVAALAAEVGSDVPFALVGGSAIGTGRGERLVPLTCPTALTWVLATSPVGLSTPAVFRRFDAMVAAGQLAGPHAAAGLGPPPAIPPALLEGLAQGDLAAIGANLINDLQPAALALRPELADLIEAAKAAGGLGAIVSGSGPTVAILAADAADAARLAVALPATCLVATGPAPGAHVVQGD